MARKNRKGYNNTEYGKYWYNVPIVCQSPDCHNLIIKSTPLSKYCSDKCRRWLYKRRDHKKRGEKIESVKCKDCGNFFERSSKHPHKKYCCGKCRRRANDRRTYRREKTEYPEKYKKRLEKKRIYSIKWREQHRKEGLCSRCNNPAMEGHTICIDCYKHLKNNYIWC